MGPNAAINSLIAAVSETAFGQNATKGSVDSNPPLRALARNSVELHFARKMIEGIGPNARIEKLLIF